MKLTPFAKVFITVILLAVVGYVLYAKRETIGQWANQDKGTGGARTDKPADKDKATAGGDTADKGISKDDFNGIGPSREAPRTGVTGISKAAVGAGKLGRKLVVGINTWAGHAPGIVANAGMTGGDKGSMYMSKYGLDVEFKLLEDPQAKLAAFKPLRPPPPSSLRAACL
mgnify:FL=1